MITREVALRRLTRRTRWVVLDVETTNSDQGKRILSVGINQWRMDPTTSQPTPAPTEWWVDPGLPVENTRIHHITTQLLAERKAVPFTHYLTKLDKILTARRGEQVVLVAHYARFDVGVLHLEYARAGRTLPDVAVLDTWSLARWLDVGASRYNLTALLAAYGLRVTQHHNAAADAYDTAELLRKLLSAAADQQVCDFDADHPTKRKEPVLRRTGDYPAAPPNRGTRATRRSRFTFIERPKTHQQAHKAQPKKPTPADLDSWLRDARSCAELRCPGLPGKVDALRVGREQMAAEFLTDWEHHLAADDPAAANTSLGAALLLLPKVTRAGDAPGWLALWEPKLRAASRCASGGPATEPVDGCPECRADRACPADAWTQTAAMLLVGAGRNFNVGNSKSWRAHRPVEGPCRRRAGRHRRVRRVAAVRNAVQPQARRRSRGRRTQHQPRADTAPAGSRPRPPYRTCRRRSEGPHPHRRSPRPTIWQHRPRLGRPALLPRRCRRPTGRRDPHPGRCEDRPGRTHRPRQPARTTPLPARPGNPRDGPQRTGTKSPGAKAPSPARRPITDGSGGATRDRHLTTFTSRHEGSHLPNLNLARQSEVLESCGRDRCVVAPALHQLDLERVSVALLVHQAPSPQRVGAEHL